MQKQELLNRMLRQNRQQKELNEAMVEVLVTQLEILKGYDTKVQSLIQFVQENHYPPELTNPMLASFADLKDNYYHFFNQCSDNLKKQIKISKQSTIALSHEYSGED